MDTLNRIVARKKEELREIKGRGRERELRARAADMPPCQEMAKALKTCPQIPIIAEIKRASPSLGLIRKVEDVGGWAQAYKAGGAAAISVLTDQTFFRGSLEDLSTVRGAVDLPVLRKDFIMEPVQLLEARVAGADAVLLIAAMLDQALLVELCAIALELGLQPLVEVHNETDVARVVEIAPPIIGINNRDLRTMRVSLEASERLRPLLPSHVPVVAESGIGGARDILRLRRAGIHAFLVGTLLMSSKDPQGTLRRLCRPGAV